MTLLITTCLILATTTFVPNIPADESCLNNLNTIFLSNAEELMEVQATRLVDDELNTAAENWTLAELNTFLEDLEDDQGEDEDEELEFNPGYLSADQTFTAMVSYGFIPEGSRDLEAYRELYHDPESLEGNVSLSRNFQVLKQYDFIPESLSLSDFRKLGGRMGLIIRGFEYPIPPEYIDVQVSKWTEEGGIGAANESWLQDDYDEFVEDLDAAWEEENKTVAAEIVFEICQEYGIIPGNKTQNELEDFLTAQYNQHQEEIDGYHDEYGANMTYHWQGGPAFITGVISRLFVVSFRVPYIYYMIESPLGGFITYHSFSSMDTGYEVGNYFAMELLIFIGVFVPPLHIGLNLLPSAFFGYTGYMGFEIN